MIKYTMTVLLAACLATQAMAGPPGQSRGRRQLDHSLIRFHLTNDTYEARLTGGPFIPFPAFRRDDATTTLRLQRQFHDHGARLQNARRAFQQAALARLSMHSPHCKSARSTHFGLALTFSDGVRFWYTPAAIAENTMVAYFALDANLAEKDFPVRDAALAGTLVGEVLARPCTTLATLKTLSRPRPAVRIQYTPDVPPPPPPPPLPPPPPPPPPLPPGMAHAHA
jgi:hypothetical protein